ncbi:MAG: DUF3109 family protein [Chitinophagaceae bacterium]|nr:DUF3109 family protein [Chitinophagaceae bacterium]
MIAIDNILISDEVVEEHFVCDLNKCKGACCDDGDAGAPLEKEELQQLNDIYETVKPYLTKEGIKEIEKRGKYLYHQQYGWVTPAIDGKMCAYGYKDAAGTTKCGIERAYNENKLNWRKPISCHLFPIRIKKTKRNDLVNYEPREDLCKAACTFGKKLKVPVYVFLKEPIIRKYGAEFYDVLEKVAADYFEAKKSNT